MFVDRGGESLMVGDGDLALKVHLPPVGYVWNWETNQLEQSEIIARSSIESEQYWERPARPDKYEKRAALEKERQELDPDYFEPELQAYREREWYRRKFGVWFMNNGKPLFLPGDYYFYLAHWTLDVGPPSFKIADLHKAYFWNYCVQDPNCYGAIELTRRRVGKCLKINTLVRMYDGSVKKVQDIRDGELVMGNDSTPRLVYGVTSGKEEMFNIIPNKGESWGCNKSHILYAVEFIDGHEIASTFTVDEYLGFSNEKKNRLNLVRVSWQNPDEREFTGFSIESEGQGSYFGFAVDNNHLFLLADGTVVHNTYFASCMMYEYTSRTGNAHAGIQSKTRADAGKVFSEKLIQPWRKLIDFFRPTYDRSQGDVPKSQLRFFETANKGSKAKDVYESSGELESWIDYENSGERAYDSQKMLRYFVDEWAKTEEADVLERHKVAKPCLENDNGEIIGKAIYASTVEDMEGHLEKYLRLWNESDINNRNANGRTVSGLYRFFTPAQKIMFVDKYGYPDEERALKQIENEIAGMTDPRDIASFIRKNPRNWKEAFRTGGDNCLYDPLKLDDRASILGFKDKSEIYEKFNLVWDDVEEGGMPKVRLIKNKNGRFKFAKAFQWPESEANNVQRKGSHFFPKNQMKFVIGIDPYDHNRTKDGTFSNGAAAVYLKHDPLDPDMSENFIGIYVSRPPTAQIFYEDMLKLCHYFSAQMLFEDNKPGIGNYFTERGYGAFMIRDAKGNPGISASPKTHQTLVEHTEIFIDESCHKVQFPELLEDWKNFDMDDTTKFDLAMASGYALIAAGRIKKKMNTLASVKTLKSTDLIRKFKLKKRYGKLSKSLY